MSWSNREKKNMSRKNLKSLSKPFRKVLPKDSQQDKNWSKLKKRLRRQEEEQAFEDVE
mgnify:FL=1